MEEHVDDVESKRTLLCSGVNTSHQSMGAKGQNGKWPEGFVRAVGLQRFAPKVIFPNIAEWSTRQNVRVADDGGEVVVAEPPTKTVGVAQPAGYHHHQVRSMLKMRVSSKWEGAETEIIWGRKSERKGVVNNGVGMKGSLAHCAPGFMHTGWVGTPTVPAVLGLAALVSIRGFGLSVITEVVFGGDIVLPSADHRVSSSGLSVSSG